MARIFITITAVILAGCATSTGVVPIGGGNYSIAREDNGPTASLANIKAAAYRDANNFCAGQGKDVHINGSTDTPRSFGQFPQVEVRFSCVAKT
jgi:hypothetical protein